MKKRANFTGEMHPLEIAKFLLELPPAHVEYSSQSSKGEVSVTLKANYSELEKLVQMQEQGVIPGQMDGNEEEPAGAPQMPSQMVPSRAAETGNVVVKVAMDEEKELRDELKSKYPKKFLENVGLA